MAIQIIKLPLSRWQEYKNLRLRALKDEPQAFSSSYTKEAAYPDEKWQERLSTACQEINSWLLFAQKNRRLVGMIGGWVEPGKDVITIFGMFVVKRERGQGIAKMLFNKLLSTIKQTSFSRCMLEVNIDQQAAFHLYQTVGFQIVGQENLVLGDGQSHQLYKMDLKI
jgi:ribosomal protein S18 acetylase RimI-like enzyme